MEEIQRIFEDETIIVCIKPAGVLSQRDASGKTNMQDLLGNVYCVHRLDREVSGIMVFAKNAKTAADLTKQIQEHTFQKEYMAVVEGNLEESSAILEDLLFKDSSKNKTFVVKKERKGVKKAKLSYETIAEGTDKTLVKIHLYTGRTHQIRVQFASRTHPVWCDRKYGSKETGNMALYSYSLSFMIKDQRKTFIYSDLANVLKERFDFSCFGKF